MLQRRNPLQPALAHQLAAALMAIAVALGAVAATPAPAEADAPAPIWQPPPELVPASANHLILVGETDDRITGGTTTVITDDAAEFVVDGASNWADLQVLGRQRWRLRVGSLDGTPLVPGEMRDQTGYVRDRGFSLTGPFSGCWETSQVAVDQVETTGDRITALALRFELRCDEATGTLRGALSWDGDAPVPDPPNPRAVPAGLWSPPEPRPAVSHVELDDYIPPATTDGHLIATDVGVSRWDADSGRTHGEMVDIAAADDQGNLLATIRLVASVRRPGLEAGWYGDLAHTDGLATAVDGGLTIRVNGYGCHGLTDQWFAIDDIDRQAGEITHLDGRWEATCGTLAMRGAIRWSATPRLTDIDPAVGPRRGGAALLPGGTDLTAILGAKVGGVTAQLTTDGLGRTRIVAPPLPVGQHDVEVTVPGGTAVLPGGYTSIPNLPTAPTDLALLPGPTTITASWTPPADLGDAPVTGIEVALIAPPPQWPTPIASTVVDPEATVALLAGLKPGTLGLVQITYLASDDRGAALRSAEVVQVPEPDVTPFDDIPTLVTQQYVDFAGRAPTGGERTLVVTAIRDGAVLPEEFVASMRDRPEWGGTRSPVTRLYAAYFGRLPDAGGLRYWADRLASHRSTLQQVSASFAGSSEFRRTYGALSDGAFVDLVYRNVLGRSPDAGGRTYWVAKLRNGASRGAVMASFSESAEHRRRTQPRVDAVLLYTGMLRRMPTAGELAAPAAGVGVRTGAPTTPAQLARQLLASPGYAARF